jgi:hypothetical protein
MLLAIAGMRKTTVAFREADHLVQSGIFSALF